MEIVLGIDYDFERLERNSQYYQMKMTIRIWSGLVYMPKPACVFLSSTHVIHTFAYPKKTSRDNPNFFWSYKPAGIVFGLISPRKYHLESAVPILDLRRLRKSIGYGKWDIATYLVDLGDIETDSLGFVLTTRDAGELPVMQYEAGLLAPVPKERDKWGDIGALRDTPIKELVRPKGLLKEYLYDRVTLERKIDLTDVLSEADD